MSSAQEERLERMLYSLEGLSVGDALGERFLLRLEAAGHLIEQRSTPAPPWRFTDDTQMALSIIAILRQHGKIDQDQLARSFAEHYDSRRGYGAAMHSLLTRIREGEPWREIAAAQFGGQGSYGNGAAMRVAPVGAFFADDLDAVIEQAQCSAQVTHTHPEATAGAIAIAVAAAWAWRLRTSTPCPSRQEFLGLILPLVPQSEVRAKVRRARELAPDATVQMAAALLGNGSAISAQDTVPFALWCAAGYLNRYEEAVWLTASGLGDIDTTCAMVGGIVALSCGLKGIPAKWRANREPLPNWHL